MLHQLIIGFGGRFYQRLSIFGCLFLQLVGDLLRLLSQTLI